MHGVDTIDGPQNRKMESENLGGVVDHFFEIHTLACLLDYVVVLALTICMVLLFISLRFLCDVVELRGRVHERSVLVDAICEVLTIYMLRGTDLGDDVY